MDSEQTVAVAEVVVVVVVEAAVAVTNAAEEPGNEVEVRDDLEGHTVVGYSWELLKPASQMMLTPITQKHSF